MELFLILQEVTLRPRKIKIPTLKKSKKMKLSRPKFEISYILGENFKVPSLKIFLIFFPDFLRVFKNRFMHSSSQYFTHHQNCYKKYLQ